MDFDFNLILVPVTLIFFLVWLLDKFVFKQRATKGKGNENFVITWAYDFWPVLAIVLCLRSFFYEPFNIPSDSMVPTLETGDFILVNKYQYGMRLPIINKKFIDIGLEIDKNDAVLLLNKGIYNLRVNDLYSALSSFQDDGLDEKEYKLKTKNLMLRIVDV
jgi:signal peptidase I